MPAFGCAPSAAELAQIALDAAAIVLDQPCTIQRKTRTPDGMGGASEIWATIYTTRAGMRQPSAGLLANYAYLIGSLATYQVLLPNGLDVRDQDRLVVGGMNLTVQVVLAPQSYSFFTNCIAAKIK